MAVVLGSVVDVELVSTLPLVVRLLYASMRAGTSCNKLVLVVWEVDGLAEDATCCLLYCWCK